MNKKATFYGSINDFIIEAIKKLIYRIPVENKIGNDHLRLVDLIMEAQTDVV